MVVNRGGTTVYVHGAEFDSVSEALLVVTMTVTRQTDFEYNRTSLTNFTSDVSVSLSAQMKQHVDNVRVNCLYVTVVYDVRKYFFGNRIVKIWNSLPATAEDFA